MFKRKKAVEPYVPKQIYKQLTSEQITWGNPESIAQLYNQGKTESEIVELTKNRRVFVQNVILRLQHPEEYVSEKPAPKINNCVLCNADISNLYGNRKHCIECNKKQPTPKIRGLLTYICKLCKKEFQRRKGEPKYCSQTCYFADPDKKTGLQHDPTKWKDVVCPNCGKTFSTLIKTNHKYCSNTCYHKVQQNHAMKEQPKPTCLRCNAPFIMNGSNTRKYCTRRCKDEDMKARWRERNPDYHRNYSREYQRQRQAERRK